MKLRRVMLDASGRPGTAIWDEPRHRWLPLTPALEVAGPGFDGLAPLADDPLEFLAAGAPAREGAARLAGSLAEADLSGTFSQPPLLPFEPRLLRAFASWEQHWVQSARGMVRRYLPRALPAISAYERVARRPFPPLRPKPLFYEQPQAYIGNHLSFYAGGEELPWPKFCRDLDFEIELGAVLAHPVKDVTPAEGEAAIGGFVVLNDLSARDVQWRETRRGNFGPLGKTKTFANAMSVELVSADEILPRVERLSAAVRVNGEIWSRTGTAGMQHSFGTMVAFAAEGEQLLAGEVLSSGTMPNGCGMELGRLLSPGDRLELEIEGIGVLENRIGRPA